MARSIGGRHRRGPERRLRGSMRSMFELRLGERVGTLPMPVLLAGGDTDSLIPLGAMLDTWRKYPPVRACTCGMAWATRRTWTVRKRWRSCCAASSRKPSRHARERGRLMLVSVGVDVDSIAIKMH